MSNNNVKFGEVDYESDVFGGDKKPNNNKDLFLRLADGPNDVRLVTSPFQYSVHKYKKEGDPGFGQKVGCSIVHGSCPLCELGDKAKSRWFYGVIDRKTGHYKVLDISFAVFSKIRDLARNAKWGDPTKYDITILVKKGAAPNDYYNVQPIPKEPLSASDQQLKDNADLDDLKRRCTPPTAEKVQERMNKINGVDGASNGKKVAAKPTSTKAPAVTMASDDSLEEDFPEYNADGQA